MTKYPHTTFGFHQFSLKFTLLHLATLDTFTTWILVILVSFKPDLHAVFNNVSHFPKMKEMSVLGKMSKN